MLFSPAVDIALISAILAVISQVMQRVLVNRKEQKRKQKEINENNKRMKELMKRNDEKSAKELAALQKEMMESMSTMMSGNMRMLAVMSIIYIPVYWFLGETYAATVIPLPVPIPWFSSESLIAFYTSTSWIGWYVLTALVFGLGINAVIGIVEKTQKGGAK